MRRTTRAFAREGRRTPGYGVLDFLHGYVYGRWPYFYIQAGMRPEALRRPLRVLATRGGRLLSRRRGATDPQSRSNRFADTYHGKVVPTAAATQLVTLDLEVELRDLEQIIPYATARDIVIKNPEHIVALECPCRAAQVSPCLPLAVCLIVGEPFASFVAAHHPTRARWITQEEAVSILQAERERGHVHHAFFKDAMLNRFYAICNCCSCCCGAMRAWKNGVPMLASSGYTAVCETDRCTGCGACAVVCPFGALSTAPHGAQVDEEACLGCGVCAAHCPSQALTLVRASNRGEPLDIRALLDR